MYSFIKWKKYVHIVSDFNSQWSIAFRHFNGHVIGNDRKLYVLKCKSTEKHTHTHTATKRWKSTGYIHAFVLIIMWSYAYLKYTLIHCEQAIVYVVPFNICTFLNEFVDYSCQRSCDNKGKCIRTVRIYVYMNVVCRLAMKIERTFKSFHIKIGLYHDINFIRSIRESFGAIYIYIKLNINSTTTCRILCYFHVALNVSYKSLDCNWTATTTRTASSLHVTQLQCMKMFWKTINDRT